MTSRWLTITPALGLLVLVGRRGVMTLLPHPPSTRGDLMSFPARYRGRCDNCGERVNIGDPIRFDELFGTRIIHEVCPDPTERRAPICDFCFTEKPCGCDDEESDAC